MKGGAIITISMIIGALCDVDSVIIEFVIFVKKLIEISSYKRKDAWAVITIVVGEQPAQKYSQRL